MGPAPDRLHNDKCVASFAPKTSAWPKLCHFAAPCCRTDAADDAANRHTNVRRAPPAATRRRGRLAVAASATTMAATTMAATTKSMPAEAVPKPAMPEATMSYGVAAAILPAAMRKTMVPAAPATAAGPDPIAAIAIPAAAAIIDIANAVAG